MRLDQDQIPWAAGLFEGEGNVGLRTPGGSFAAEDSRRCYPSAALVSTDEDVVRDFCEIVGVGKVYGPYPGRKPGHKEQWSWRLSGIDSFVILYDLLRPYMHDRRGQKFDEVFAGMRRINQTNAVCGTRSAANKHRRLGEPLCDACREAERLHGVAQRMKAVA